ncbi:MAG: thermonuclease family protein [Mycobacterium leprae]
MARRKAPRMAAFLLWLALVLTGCGGAPSLQTPSAGGAAGCLVDAPRPPADARRVVVSRVVDGDTVHLADGTTVRLIGMNTPESVDPRRPVQAYGKEASAYTKQLLEGKEILLEPGRTPKDQYGRLLGWLWLPDGRFVNALLVRDGYAQVYTFSDNPDNAQLLLSCQREARAASRGLWALDAYKDGEQAAKMDRNGTSSSAAQTGSPAAGVRITREPGTVARGSTATLVAQTSPKVQCAITVIYKSGASQAEALQPRQADSQGAVRWSWAIASTTAVGTWPVRVSCGGPEVETTLTVR